MNTECRHTEEWSLTIRREARGTDDADWAETLPVKGTRTRHYRPDTIHLRLRKHDTLPVTVAIHGDKTGPPSSFGQSHRTTSRYLMGRDLPEFAEALVERARQLHGCGENVVHPYD